MGGVRIILPTAFRGDVEVGHGELDYCGRVVLLVLPVAVLLSSKRHMVHLAERRLASPCLLLFPSLPSPYKRLCAQQLSDQGLAYYRPAIPVAQSHRFRSLRLRRPRCHRLCRNQSRDRNALIVQPRNRRLPQLLSAEYSLSTCNLHQLRHLVGFGRDHRDQHQLKKFET